ncbi:SGNH hydrolase-type esterase domain-containing protein [Plasmodiophora brassicae]|uniref:SGNH hydrolase-type esterase domain-containing protein n=1 Tax=Plasmodiophora brassicae TaxID=37360 RepID=A0A0G4IYZ2_PLABS|nr:hypothetical protein PBRA_001600 [Plasmodiophora brassicae]SPQ93959.1 unnamed protein product [Plasmodiophora brassicae]
MVLQVIVIVLMEVAEGTVPSNDFYHPVRSYHGHDVGHLQVCHSALRRRASSIVFLAGDSSLDNKYWITGPDRHREAAGAYADVLAPPVQVADVAYHLTAHGASALNCAVEESALADRERKLLPQDEFIRDHIGPNDVLVVSVGGNDIALKASASTKWNMCLLVYVNSLAALSDPVKSATCRGMPHFLDMFGRRLQAYIEKLTAKARPKKTVVCMIYYPDERQSGGWADGVLNVLKYNTEPQRLQHAIKAAFEHAVSKIRIDGTDVIPLPLYAVLDGKDTDDYVARVEPSGQGGRKMADAIFTAARLDQSSTTNSSTSL